VTITAGQLLSTIQGIGQLGLDTSWAAQLNLSNLAADTVVGEDILSVVALFWPPAALFEAALAVAVAIGPLLLKISVTPDPLPMTDAQMIPARGGRNG
jgi:hypothetical protein